MQDTEAIVVVLGFVKVIKLGTSVVSSERLKCMNHHCRFTDYNMILYTIIYYNILNLAI